MCVFLCGLFGGGGGGGGRGDNNPANYNLQFSTSRPFRRWKVAAFVCIVLDLKSTIEQNK